MRNLANVLLALAISAWTAAFFFGPANSGLWKIGSWSHYIVGAALFLHLFAFIFPSQTTVAKRSTRRGEVRKCRTCGRPAVPGSDYCRYHTDEMRAMGGGGI